MNKLEKMSSLATAAVVSLAAWAPLAHAGHLNTVLQTTLDGREQVDTNAVSNAMVGDPNGRGEAYVFGIDGTTTTLCYTIVGVKKVAELNLAPGNGRAAHIHEGARGSNGPVVANLAWPQDGQAGDCISETQGTAKFPTAEAGIVQRILKNPKSFYINIHNTVYPNGAVRGQLSDTADHAH
ncbi:MAG: CHRD domain-containing protein [Burkholderiaceae bacterium]